MFKRILSITLILLHLATFGPVREALAFYSSSSNYNLEADVGGGSSAERSAGGASNKIQFDSLGEPCVGRSESANYILNSGFIPIIQSNPPVASSDIPDYYSWPPDTANENALDLDDYFTSPEGYPLTYKVSSSTNIKVHIDPATHEVTFTPEPGFWGVQRIRFTAVDSQGNTASSKDITLQVLAPQGSANSPAIISAELLPLPVKQGDNVTLTVKAVNPDNRPLSFSYSDYFVQTDNWSEGVFYYSRAVWQAPSAGAKHYPLVIKAEDASGLSDALNIVVNVGNFNHPPVLDPIAPIVTNEGELAVIAPSARDEDGDAVTFYFSPPFDAQGRWLTGYEDEGSYNVTVTASDGIDTVSQIVRVTINHTNRPPEVSLILSKYTVRPNESIDIMFIAADADRDALTFVLKKDGVEIDSGTVMPGYKMQASFADIGGHNISVTVTDAAGASVSDTKGVDVADPNANRDNINPVMGDFNGDALTDLGLHDSTTGKWQVCLSDKGEFRNAVDWLSGFGTSRDWWPVGGDFNGDAKTDAGIYNITGGELKIAHSSGSGFSGGETYLKFSEASYSWQPFTGNFNADKFTDFAVYNRDTGEVRVSLGSAAGFQPFVSWITGFGNDYAAFGGDFNGDGLTDLCLFRKSGGEFKVAFSNSKAFVDGSSWLSGFASGYDALVSDFNNDGLADVGYWDKNSGNWFYAISTGDRFVDKGVWLENFGTADDESATTGDFDGNGLTDAAVFDRDLLGINRWKTKLSDKRPADLLTEIDNGIGGKTKVTYTYAAKNQNSGLPFPVYAASSISSINTYPADRSAVYTQDFEFSGGYFDATEREFRGFAKVKVTDPITKNYTETYFFQGKPGQDGALKGQIEKVLAYDGNKRLISSVENTYTVKKSGPEESFLGHPALTAIKAAVYEEDGSSVATRDKLAYDNIGNVIETESAGDLSKAGGERITETRYTRPYELGFNRPTETALKDKDSNIISQKSFEYDPKNGNLTKDTVFIFDQAGQGGEPAQSISTLYSYDSFGNLTSATNALGSAATTDYETDFYTFPKKVTNALGHSVTYIYEPKFGAATAVTDANGAVTTTAYDSLGRPVYVRNALDQVATTYAYGADFCSKTTTNAAGLFKTEYIDGLGRKYRSVSSGEDGVNQRNVCSEVFFNDRGLTSHESLPRYVDEDPGQISYVRYVYDLRGRVKKTIADFPGTTSDAESSINYITPLYTETTDPLGHRKGTLKDVWGNVIEVTEFTSEGVFKTGYTYDIQNNLTQTTDTLGNITRITYDSLGRKTRMIDPDMGTWLYEYDAVGNLVTQTDAKGQVLVFEYDSINRLKKKSLRGGAGAEATEDEMSEGVPSPSGARPISEYFYDGSDVGTAYYAVPKENCIGRLSKVADQSGSTEFFYDKLGREVKSIKSLRGAAGAEAIYKVERSYDVLDRLTALTYPDDSVVNYEYDVNSGLFQSLRGAAGAEAISYVKDIVYNANGQIKTIQYGNGTSTNYTYGPDLRLSNIRTTNDQRLTTLQDLNYAFDKNGNVTTLIDNVSSRRNTRSFRYDSLDRLIEEQKNGSVLSSYEYDPIGNMTYKSDVGRMTYGEGAGPHAVTTAGGYTYQYDLNGNMTSGRNRLLAYDAENRLKEVNESGIITSFVYDGDGGLVRSEATEGEARGSAESDRTRPISTTYIGSLFEKDSYGTAKKHIFAGSTRVATNILRASPDGSVGASREDIVYFHGDHLGSSNVITDQNGNQSAYYEYAPYGTTRTSDVIANPEGVKQSPTNYLFTGKQLFDTTGLYHYGARFYDPVLGRFITADTIVQAPYDPQSLNRYAYCRNNPLSYIDPDGHWFWAVVAIIAKVAAAVSVVSAVAGAISLAAGNRSLANMFFQVSQYSGYVAAAAGIASFTNAAMQASSSSQSFSLNSILCAFDESAPLVTMDPIIVTPTPPGMAISVAWQVTKDAIGAGITGAVSAAGSAIAQAGSWVGTNIVDPVYNTVAQPGYNYGNWMYGQKNFANFLGACLDSAWAITGVYGAIETVAASGPPYWQYYPAGTDYSSPYVTRGWNPPYKPGEQAFKALRLDLARRPNPGTAVRQVKINWWERVAGGRTVRGGTGKEFYRGRFSFPRD